MAIIHYFLSVEYIIINKLLHSQIINFSSIILGLDDDTNMSAMLV